MKTLSDLYTDKALEASRQPLRRWEDFSGEHDDFSLMWNNWVLGYWCHMAKNAMPDFPNIATA